MSFLDILQKLVEFPTFEPDGIHRFAEFVSNQLKNASFRVVVDEFDNVYGVREFSVGSGTLLLTTNIDSGDSRAGWTRNPLSLTLEGDRLYGLDTSTKGGTAAALQVLKDLSACRFRKLEVFFPNDHRLPAGPASEPGGEQTGIEYFLLRNKLDARVGINLNATVQGDRFAVSLGCGGRVGFTVRAIGKQGHTMDPSWRTLSRNAIYDMMKVIDALRMIPPQRMTIDGREVWTQLNVSIIEGGKAINIVPGDCTITCERRVIPNGDWDECKREVEDALRTVRDVEFKVTYFPPARPYLIDRDNDIATLVADSVQRVLAYRPVFTAQAGITDSAILYQMGGVKTVIMGPGDPLLEHKPDEYVSAKRVEEFAKVIHSMLEETTGSRLRH